MGHAIGRSLDVVVAPLSQPSNQPGAAGEAGCSPRKYPVQALVAWEHLPRLLALSHECEAAIRREQGDVVNVDVGIGAHLREQATEGVRHPGDGVMVEEAGVVYPVDPGPLARLGD